MLNRRHMLAVPAAIAVAAIPVVTQAVPSQITAEQATAYAEQESRAINAIAARLNAGNYSDEVWEAWNARDTKFLNWAVSLPTISAYAKAKAIAFRTIHERNGGIESYLEGQPALDSRLALQVVQCALWS